ncbi:S8 family serine peptidase [Lysobacter enzymogenes]|uniref:S8 family serine peptidase n=1 Tax=Lysobacter enzymogenes TaxID=69 RepID=UPI00384DFFE5
MPNQAPPSRTALSRWLLPMLVCTAIPFVPAAAQAPQPAAHPHAFPKPARTQPGRYDSRDIIEVKFARDAAVSLRGGRLSAAGAGSTAALDRLLGGAGPIASAEPLFTLAPAALSALSAHAKSAAVQPGLERWFRLRLRPGQDIAQAIDRLNALDVVEIATPAPLPAPPPSLPDYSGAQLYKRRDYNGIGSQAGRDMPGGDGTGIRVLDIEYSWNTQHEDLSKLRAPGAFIANGTPVDPFNDSNHGTAVMGIVSADDNGFGVTGLVDRASAHFTNAMNLERGYDGANAILVAANALRAGDVMMIEQQTPGPSGCTGYVPLEWIPSVYDAIVAATNKGIYVVEAAGNGNMNLDDAACFGSPFPRGRPHSGALIVGAGGPGQNPVCNDTLAARARQPFSNYGARVDLQAWGSCVATTGYAGYWPFVAGNAGYTPSFSGTSAATPIVAAAVVAVSGAYQLRFGETVDPATMRYMLTRVGMPQTGNDGNIGPLPYVPLVLQTF